MLHYSLWEVQLAFLGSRGALYDTLNQKRNHVPRPIINESLTTEGQADYWLTSGVGLTDSNPNPIVNLKPFFTFTFNHQIRPILFVQLFWYQSSYFHFYYSRTIISCLDGSLPCFRLMCFPNKLVFIHKHVPLPVLPMSVTSTPCIRPARWWITCRAMKQGYHTSLNTELGHVNSKMGQTEARKFSFLKGGIESANYERRLLPDICLK